MDIQALKNKVLQLAIEGKLVEQRPEEGTGQDLFNQILEEKQKLIAEGKIKKEKELSPITDEEIPFDIPESWEWTRIGLVTSYNQTKEKVSSTNLCNDTLVLDLEDIEKESGIILEKKLAKDKIIKGEKLKFTKGDILYSKLRPYLKKILIAPSSGVCSSEIVPFSAYGCLINTYVMYFMKSPLVDSIANENSYGVKMPRVSSETICNIPIPLPPLEEQKRIVAKIEKIFSVLDKLQRLFDENTNIKVQLKKKILQYAIEGKLVDQRPEEGTGQDLFNQIQEEKQKLIAEGKIKKEKALAPILDKDISFDVPDSWKWCKLGDIGVWASGATPSRTNPLFYQNGSIPWLKTGDLTDGYINEIPELISQLALECTSVKLYPPGAVLMAMYGATIGKLGILSIPATTNQACCACCCFEGLFNKYLFYFLMSSRQEFISKGEGGAQPNISKEKIVNHLIPLPPLEEQKRIVAKIEKIFSVLDKLQRLFDENTNIKVQLKKKILQYAIEGKLVEQRSEEGTGLDLFNQIQEEKQKLIAEGKIKKEKALEPITDEEIPFDIPDSWLWCRVNSISEIDPRNNLSDDKQISFIPMKLVDDGFGNHYTTENKYWKDVKKGFNHIAEDDIGVAKITPCFQNRKSVIFKKLPFKFGATTTELKIVRRYGSLQSSDYLFWFFKTNYFIENGVNSFTGSVGQQRIHKDYLESCLLPLPPLEEQKRIVAKIEELFALCDKLDLS